MVVREEQTRYGQFLISCKNVSTIIRNIYGCYFAHYAILATLLRIGIVIVHHKICLLLPIIFLKVRSLGYPTASWPISPQSVLLLSTLSGKRLTKYQTDRSPQTGATRARFHREGSELLPRSRFPTNLLYTTRIVIRQRGIFCSRCSMRCSMRCPIRSSQVRSPSQSLRSIVPRTGFGSKKRENPRQREMRPVYDAQRCGRFCGLSRVEIVRSFESSRRGKKPPRVLYACSANQGTLPTFDGRRAREKTKKSTPGGR